MLGKLVIAAALLVSTGALAGPKEDMMAADRAFAKMSLEKGAHAAFLAYMTDDVRLYDGEHPPIIGKRAAETYYAKNPIRRDRSSTGNPSKPMHPPRAISVTRAGRGCSPRKTKKAGT